MKKKPADRRRRTRVPLKSTIVHSLFHAAGDPVREQSASVDLSSSGISFLAQREYAKGALVMLEALFEGEPLSLLVCVVRSKRLPNKQFEVGAELVAIDPGHKKKLIGHLEALIESAKTSAKKTRQKPAKKSAPKKPAKKKKKTQSRKMKKAAPRRQREA